MNFIFEMTFQIVLTKKKKLLKVDRLCQPTYFLQNICRQMIYYRPLRLSLLFKLKMGMYDVKNIFFNQIFIADENLE